MAAIVNIHTPKSDHIHATLLRHPDPDWIAWREDDGTVHSIPKDRIRWIDFLGTDHDEQEDA